MFHSLTQLFLPNETKKEISVTIFSFSRRTTSLDSSGRFYVSSPIERVWVGTIIEGVPYVSSAEVVLGEDSDDKVAERKLRRIWNRGQGEEVTLDFVKTGDGLLLIL